MAVHLRAIMATPEEYISPHALSGVPYLTLDPRKVALARAWRWPPRPPNSVRRRLPAGRGRRVPTLLTETEIAFVMAVIALAN